MSGNTSIAKTHKRHQRRLTASEANANQPFANPTEYGGTVPPEVKAKNRVKNKAAKKARRAARKGK